jgi:cell division protein FtsB
MILTLKTSYFSSWFHIFDSLVIIVAFVIEIALQGLEEELGSLVVVLRLWRVFQIIEELRSASEDSMEKYEDEIERLRQENASLKQRLNLDVGGNEDMP